MLNKEEIYTHRLSLIELMTVDKIIEEVFETYIDITTQEYTFIRDMIEDADRRSEDIILLKSKPRDNKESIELHFFIDDDRERHTYLKQELTQQLRKLHSQQGAE